MGCCLAILDAIDAALLGLFGSKIQAELLANDASEKAADRMLLPFSCSHDRSDCCAAGVRSIAMMRACLVAGRAADFDDAGVGRLRDLDLLDFGEAERVAALAVDLGLVMGSSEVHAAPSAAPPQPRPGKSPRRAGPRSPPQPLQVTTATLRSRPKASHF